VRRFIAVGLAALAALALAASGFADPDEDGKAKKRHSKYQFTVATTDNGSCQNEWANLVLRRTFQVKDNGDGTFTLTRRDRGTFVTNAGRSPGACDTTGRHGQVVVAGVRGKIVGFLRGKVTGGTFNPNATCPAPAAECGFTDVFIATFFGPNAEFTCFTNSRDCAFNYNYTAPKRGTQELKYRHWQDKGKGAGSFLREEFIGDIASS
jgi:hypothetical protein